MGYTLQGKTLLLHLLKYSMKLAWKTFTDVFIFGMICFQMCIAYHDSNWWECNAWPTPNKGMAENNSYYFPTRVMMTGCAINVCQL